MIIRSPGLNVRRMPPAALETNSARAPSACSTRTGKAASVAECPSYMWKRPASATTGRPPSRPAITRTRRARPRWRRETAGPRRTARRVASSMRSASPPRPEPSTMPRHGRRCRCDRGSLRRAGAARRAVLATPVQLTTGSLSRSDAISRWRASQQRAALGVRQERALEAVHRDLRQLVEGEVERLRGMHVLVGERRAAHEPVVGVEHDVQAALEVFAERMRRVRPDDARLHVARQADLERDPCGRCSNR